MHDAYLSGERRIWRLACDPFLPESGLDDGADLGGRGGQSRVGSVPAEEGTPTALLPLGLRIAGEPFSLGRLGSVNAPARPPASAS